MTIDNKTVLVTGATGFLGGHLVARLAAEGATVHALARRPGRDRYITGLPNVQTVMGDIMDAERMAACMDGVDVVFHVAAALGGDLETQRRINVVGTTHIMNAAAQAGVQRVVHVSTVSVYGYRHRTDITEAIPPDPGADPYHITKAEAEAAVHEIGARYDVPYTIIRPSMIYGPRSTAWTRTMFKVAQRGVWFGDGSGATFPIYVDDVVDLCVLVATHPQAIGETFNCTPDPSPTWREFLGAYQALTGRERWLGLPVPLVRPVVNVIAALSPRHSQRKDLPDLLGFITSNVTYRMDKARDLLGWSPSVALADGVRRCVPYLREKGLLNDA